MAALLFITFIVLLVLGVPVAFSIVLSSRRSSSTVKMSYSECLLPRILFRLLQCHFSFLLEI